MMTNLGNDSFVHFESGVTSSGAARSWMPPMNWSMLWSAAVSG